MEKALTDLLTASSLPVLSAFLLGLLTAISPCPLATNITAIGYLGKDMEIRHKVFYKGLIYTLGRAFSYTAIAVVIFFGVDQFRLSGFFQNYGEKIIGPLLLVIGLFMLGLFTTNFPGTDRFMERITPKNIKGYGSVFILGAVFALAFCPYSGILYFGMLIPMTISSASGLYLPIIFALATGIPVILFAWLIAYTVSGVGTWYRKLKIVESWFRKIVAVLFVAVGIYYIIRIYF